MAHVEMISAGHYTLTTGDGREFVIQSEGSHKWYVYNESGARGLAFNSKRAAVAATIEQARWESDRLAAEMAELATEVAAAHAEAIEIENVRAARIRVWGSLANRTAALDSIHAAALTEDEARYADILYPRCVACGEPSDYCQGHPCGTHGRDTIDAHDDGDHDNCHRLACADADMLAIATAERAERRAKLLATITPISPERRAAAKRAHESGCQVAHTTANNGLATEKATEAAALARWAEFYPAPTTEREAVVQRRDRDCLRLMVGKIHETYETERADVIKEIASYSHDASDRAAVELALDTPHSGATQATNHTLRYIAKLLRDTAAKARMAAFADVRRCEYRG